jgi:hypothetical protein
MKRQGEGDKGPRGGKEMVKVKEGMKRKKYYKGMKNME